MPVPLCTAGEEKLAGEPGGRKGWRRRQAESAAKMPLAKRTPPNIWERKRERDREREIHASDREGVSSRWVRREEVKNRKDMGEKIGSFVNFMNRRIEMELTFSFQTYKSVRTK